MESYNDNTERFQYSTPGTLAGRINQFLPSPIPTREEHCRDSYAMPNADGMIEVQKYECLEAGREYWIMGVFSATIDGVLHNIAGRAEGAFLSLVKSNSTNNTPRQCPSKIRFRIHKFIASSTPKTLPRIKNSPESLEAIDGGKALHEALKELIVVAPPVDSIEDQMNRIEGAETSGVKNISILPDDIYKSVPYKDYKKLYDSDDPARFHASNVNQYEFLLLDTIPHLLKMYIYLPAKKGVITAKQTTENAAITVVQDEKNLKMLMSAIINNNIGSHNDSYGTWRDVPDALPPSQGGRNRKRGSNRRRKTANRRKNLMKTRCKRSRTRRTRRT